MEYSQITNRLYYGLNGENDNSIYRHIQDSKVILVLDYLYSNASMNNTVNATLKQIIECCGYKLSYKKGETNDQFKAILVGLNELNIIAFNGVIDKPTTVITIDTSNLFVIDENNKPTRYFKFEYVIVDKIKKATKTNKQFINLVKYYYNFACRFGTGRDITCSGNSGATWLSYYELSNQLSLSESEIKKYNDILIDLDLLVVENIGMKKNREGTITECNNIYMPKKENYTIALDSAKKQYTEHLEKLGYTILENAKTTNDKRLNGELGGLIRLSNQGQATQQQLDRIKEIKAIQNDIKQSNDKEYLYKKINANIFNEIEEEQLLLSRYYYNENDNYRYNYCIDLEEKLGLINKDYELDVDYEFYKEVMLNYTKDKHDYFIELVATHKLEKQEEEYSYMIDQFNQLKQNIIPLK